MKMTKIEFWRKVKENGGGCYNILCNECPYSKKGDGCTRPNSTTKKEAEAYIKRHERKSRKKPKPVKTVGIDNSDVTLAKPTVKENLSVPCEHLINGDLCGNAFEPCDKDCPANSEIPDPIRVDIPDIFYCPTPQGILRFKRSQIILKDINNDDCLLKLHEEYPCYRTIEEAVIVAKRLWSIK